ncbi:MAG: hypothetical protein ABI045_02085 [Flavobacteriales bacterium]
MLAGKRSPSSYRGIYGNFQYIFMVIPMLLQNITMPMYYNVWLGDDPTQVIRWAGILFLLAAISVILIKIRR